MALTPNITACLKGCGTIVIEDITGFYNATTNTGGWNDSTTAFKLQADGSPYITEATLSYSLNGGTYTDVNVLTAIQDSIFPHYELYEYAPVDINGNSTLQDGYYNIKLTLVDSDDNTYITDVDFVVYCNVECCVSKMAANLSIKDCDGCDSQSFDDFMTAYGILQALKAVAQCSGTEQFYKLLTKLQKLCNQTSTGGCGCGCS